MINYLDTNKGQIATEYDNVIFMVKHTIEMDKEFKMQLTEDIKNRKLNNKSN